MKLFAGWLFVAAAACCSQPKVASPADPAPDPAVAAEDPRAARLDAVVTKTLEGRPVTGLSVAVVQRGDVVLSRGYRLAEVASARPAAPETVYRIGSLTKSFTAAAIVKLAAAGKLSIDDPVTKHLPDYDTKGKVITLRHLLTHTSGIKGYTALDEFNRRSAEAFPRSELVDLFEKEPLLFDPGAQWSYSNSGYYLLGLVIEQVTGQPYAEALRALVLGPAGLTATTYCPSEMTGDVMARGYHLTPDEQVALAEPLDMAHPYAAGALCSTAADVARWLAWLAADRATWEPMTTRATLTGGEPADYGFGLGLGEFEGHRMISHGGGINGFISHMRYFPDDELAIVVLTNFEGRAAPELADKLSYAALDLAEPVVTDLALSPSDAAPFPGTYEIAELKVKLGMRYQGGKLQTTNYDEQGVAGPWLALAWQGGTAFELTQAKAKLRFVVEAGKATAVEIEQGGKAFTAVRTGD